MPKSYTGINIQWPISEQILNGKKLIETRTYPIPLKYINKEMLMIETPGSNGKFKSRGVAIIKFTKFKKYNSKKEFYEDESFHLVNKESAWAWKSKEKYGWYIEIIRLLSPPIDLTGLKKGIIYTKNIQV